MARRRRKKKGLLTWFVQVLLFLFGAGVAITLITTVVQVAQKGYAFITEWIQNNKMVVVGIIVCVVVLLVGVVLLKRISRKSPDTKFIETGTVANPALPVYITRSGSKYHYHSDCSTIKSARLVTQTTIKEAIMAGLKECELCR
jgi:hypothetical protein